MRFLLVLAAVCWRAEAQSNMLKGLPSEAPLTAVDGVGSALHNNNPASSAPATLPKAISVPPVQNPPSGAPASLPTILPVLPISLPPVPNPPSGAPAILPTIMPISLPPVPIKLPKLGFPFGGLPNKFVGRVHSFLANATAAQRHQASAIMANASLTRAQQKQQLGLLAANISSGAKAQYDQEVANLNKLRDQFVANRTALIGKLGAQLSALQAIQDNDDLTAAQRKKQIGSFFANITDCTLAAAVSYLNRPKAHCMTPKVGPVTPPPKILSTVATKG